MVIKLYAHRFHAGGAAAGSLFILIALCSAVVPPTQGGFEERSIVLQAAAPHFLSSGYRLPVVSVPDAPLGVPQEGVAGATGCPLVVRAVVVAEKAADSFALIESAGRSRLVRVGSSLSVGDVKAKVQSIAEGVVVLTSEQKNYRCGLGG